MFYIYLIFPLFHFFLSSFLVVKTAAWSAAVFAFLVRYGLRRSMENHWAPRPVASLRSAYGIRQCRAGINSRGRAMAGRSAQFFVCPVRIYSHPTDVPFCIVGVSKMDVRPGDTKTLHITSQELNNFSLFSLIFTGYNNAIQRMKRKTPPKVSVSPPCLFPARYTGRSHKFATNPFSFFPLLFSCCRNRGHEPRFLHF